MNIFFNLCDILVCNLLLMLNLKIFFTIDQLL